jgi:shikimate kinase
MSSFGRMDLRRRGGGEIRMAGLLPHEPPPCIAPVAMTRTLPRPKVPIVLVGIMGVGKSTVGRLLATRLLLPFVDSDKELERAAANSIIEIFDRFGEAHFRNGERWVMSRLIEGGPKVISAGGGAFIDTETRALVLERCVAVWLEADIATVAARVRRRALHRPLLAGKELRPLLRALSMARGPFYEQAHLHVRSDPGPPEETVDRIIAALAEWER